MEIYPSYLVWQYKFFVWCAEKMVLLVFANICAVRQNPGAICVLVKTCFENERWQKIKQCWRVGGVVGPCLVKPNGLFKWSNGMEGMEGNGRNGRNEGRKE